VTVGDRLTLDVPLDEAERTWTAAIESSFAKKIA
jgi:hypothetical protein